MPSDLTTLKNIGAKSAAWLQVVGVETAAAAQR
jgi:hypothetical protein